MLAFRVPLRVIRVQLAVTSRSQAADLGCNGTLTASVGRKFSLFRIDDRLYGPARKGGVSVSAQRVEEDWQVRAACRGPQAVVFFPPSHFERKSEKLKREEQAKAICATCAVREPCLSYALRIREPHGIWGGLSEAERRALVAQHN
jgi:WhiB family transcriptional regulator, redox-sensing transcriptional regulator